MIRQVEFELPARERGFHLITQAIVKNAGVLPENGILNIFLKHTSAGIIINENADSDVRHDLESYMDRAVPEGSPFYTHTIEGPDDMPAHVKAALFGQSLTIPFSDHVLNLGTWQGIYLCEFRSFVLTIMA